MHGAILAELQDYVQTKHGQAAWAQVLERAGLKGKQFDPLGHYPDAEALAIVSTASQLTGQPVPQILFDFGRFIAPHLLSMFWGIIQPGWRTLDLLEHTEESIHSLVRIKQPRAEPPQLKAKRVGPNEVVITYSSARKMCALAKGIAQGVAEHYKETIALEEQSCMSKGDEACVLSVRLVSH